jgi:ferredoxin
MIMARRGEIMIIGERKPLDEIVQMIGDKKKVLVMGCGGCVTICLVGGEKEAGVLAAELRMKAQKDNKNIETEEITVVRQCEPEYIEQLAEKISENDIAISLACGIGVQAVSERFKDTKVVPGINTSFMGWPIEHGIWVEYCKACGDCMLDITDGLCPIARCSKNLFNGPCGGTTGEGKCEVSKETDCIWYLIVNRLEERGEINRLEKVQPIKDWRTAGFGGPRKITREDLIIDEGEEEGESEATTGGGS